MVDRMLDIPKNRSFFLFGPRQTGKSTLLRNSFNSETSIYYDLLNSDEYIRFSTNPSIFREEILDRIFASAIS